MLRRGERTQNSILEELSQRIRSLEETASRRALPPGYRYVVNNLGQLTIVRDSDSASVVIL